MDTLVLLFLIAALGYGLGAISIKGFSFGSSGVLLVALVFGHYGLEVPALLRNFGLVAFVTAVGFIAGPVFFENFKKRAMAYVIIGFVTIVIGAAVCVAVIKLGHIPVPLAVGLMTGALTSTPGLAAAVEATGDATASVGYGIAYPFGVLGVVFFVQIVPKLMGGKTAATVTDADEPEVKTSVKKDLFKVDPHGLFPYSVAVVLGVLIGSISIPLPGGAVFSLGTSGGPLLTGLVMGHFGRVGKISLEVPKATLNAMRELGLILFLMGAGTNAGKGFLEILKQYGISLFLQGAVMTILPMVVVYFLATKILGLNMLSALGSICGGMTSTPALGTLLSISSSDEVTTSYAAAYPVALICVVLASQFISIFLM
ncbi:MAG TPA: hypothetical protein VN446_06930 [Candidatus Acidoferrum sp.]|nr:hypothetical protein [Candidatus Acidoferrum sp.]